MTGAGGFVGRALFKQLRATGHSAVGVDDLSAPGSHLHPGVGRRRVEDLTDVDLAGIDSVVHLAAAKRVDASFYNLDAVGRNLRSDTHLFQLAYACRVPQLVFASTCEVYGAVVRDANRETHTPRPLSPYAVGKRASEQVLLSTRELYGATKVSILRLFNVYGPDEALPAVVPAFLAARRAGLPLTIHGSGMQARDFSYISDTVAMISTVIEASVAPSILNVGTGVATTISEVAELVSTVGEHPHEILYEPGRPSEVPVLRSDTTLWRRCFGAVPSRTLAVGIRDCWTGSEYGEPSRSRPPLLLDWGATRGGLSPAEAQLQSET